jgi:MFS family permease
MPSTIELSAARSRALGVGLVLAVTLVAFETTAVVTALPTITDELQGDSLYGATLSAYMLADIVALVASGETIDRRGLKVPFGVAICLFMAGLIVSASAPTMAVVLIGRILQGAGTGALAPISYSTVKRVFPVERQPTMYAFLSVGWVLPSLLAPALAGIVTDHIGWRWVFLGMLPLGAVIGAVTFAALSAVADRPAPAPGTTRPPSRLPQAVRLAAGVGAIVVGLQEAKLWLAAILVLGGVSVALPAFRRLAPAGTGTAQRGLPAIIASRFLATAAFLGADSFIPLAADRIHGARPIVQGFTVVGAALSWSLGAFIAARHPPRHVRRPVRLGFALIIAGVVTVIPILDESWPLWATFIGWSLGGLGMGILFNPTTVAAMTYAGSGQEGLVSSQLHLADSLGFGIMGGVGGATVAVADRTSWSLTGALGTNLTLAIACGLFGIVIAGRAHPRIGGSADSPADTLTSGSAATAPA